MTIRVGLLFLMVASAAGHPPWAIALAPDGWVVFSALESIWKVDPKTKAAVCLRAHRAGRHTHDFRLTAAGVLEGEDFEYRHGKFFTARWRLGLDGRFEFTEPPAPGPARYGEAPYLKPEFAQVAKVDKEWQPVGQVRDRRNDVYVLEYGFQPPSRILGHRVRRVSAAGASTVLIQIGAQP
jgi:hypothetical protein